MYHRDTDNYLCLCRVELVDDLQIEANRELMCLCSARSRVGVVGITGQMPNRGYTIYHVYVDANTWPYQCVLGNLPEDTGVPMSLRLHEQAGSVFGVYVMTQEWLEVMVCDLAPGQVPGRTLTRVYRFFCPQVYCARGLAWCCGGGQPSLVVTDACAGTATIFLEDGEENVRRRGDVSHEREGFFLCDQTLHTCGDAVFCGKTSPLEGETEYAPPAPDMEAMEGGDWPSGSQVDIGMFFA